MTSLKHEGLSGAGFKVEESIITKWTKGHESAPKLRNSCYEQTRERIEGNLLPIKAIPVWSFNDSKDYFEFSMPNCSHLETGFTSNPEELTDQLYTSFKNRVSKFKFGFKDQVNRELLKYPDSKYKNQILRVLEKSPDHYPHGYCHGDMGFANMLVEDGQIYMIDFTESFIESPLMDLATMALSLTSSLTTLAHCTCYVNIVYKLGLNQHQIDVLALVKILGYFKQNDTPERIAELERFFNGFL